MAKIIVNFSIKGGVGKTILASNLAVSLANDQAKKVCLIDLDMQAVGDMARMLDMHPTKTMADWIGQLKRTPGAANKEDYIFHNSLLNLDFIPAVTRPQSAPHVDPLQIKNILASLDKSYDYIVVDAGKQFSDVFIATLNQSNLILLVVTPDILSIYQTKWALDTLQFLHFPLAMTRIVLNRAESLASISWQEVRVNLPAEIIAKIPSEGKICGQAINRGVPLVIDSPKTKIAMAIKALAQDLAVNEKLYLPARRIDELKIKEILVSKGGDFWLQQGLTEPLQEPEVYSSDDEILILKRRIHARLIEELNLKRMDSRTFADSKKTQELKIKAEMMVTNFLAEEAGSLISSSEIRKKLVKEMLDEALGLGPLEDLLADPSITDIMVNNKDEIYVERFGKIEMTSKKFISNDQLKTIIERIIAPIGRRIDESVPMVDARLPDGSRVNAIIPPLSLTGPTLTIRKFRKERFKIEELIGMGSLSQGMADFIKASVLCRKNIIVSGGTGSGKTTVLNILSAFIPDQERIVTIEDAAELKLSQEHWVRLESRAANIEGRGAVTIRDLFRNTLRMRPDRIIVGECRGVETLDMLQAMNTGHDGSMTTVHANSTRDVLSRFDSMILMSGIELPIRAIREMIASAVNIIVHTARLSDGSRKVLQVTEITGMKDDMHIAMKDIFTFKQTGIDAQGKVLGDFKPTGELPTFMEEIKIKGIPLPENTFSK
ncbi:MAG: Flp pilus assembly complex ATPase component TadA [Candidatus Omnitrophica bacterium]|jgi:septum site-determining protein MinD|nr:Flp pilus assembly complex ATPase component TadA [Candidatus Omnitrophota bacterium]